MNDSKFCFSKIQEKDIFLFVGCTGAGKTTTIQYLCGAQFQPQQIRVERGGILNHLQASDCDISVLSLSTSPHSESCTSAISAVQTEFKKGRKMEEILLVDAPGFEETKGIEYAISGQNSIVEATKKSSGVVLVVVINWKASGDRMTSVKRVCKFVSGMVRKIENNTIRFVFTNCKSEDKGSIKGSVDDFIQQLNQEDSADKQFMSLIDQLELSVDDSDNILIIDPFDTQNRDKILLKLSKATKIEQDQFRTYFQDREKSALNNHAQMILDHHVRFMGLKHNNYAVLKAKIEEMQFLYQILEMNQINEKYSEAVQLIKKEIQAKYDSLKDPQGVLTIEYFEKFKKNKEIAKNLLEILNNTCKSSFSLDFDCLLTKIVDSLEPLEDLSHDTILTLKNLNESFSHDFVKDLFQKGVSSCQLQVSNLVNQIMEQNDFQNTAEKIQELQKLKDKFAPILEVNIEQVIQKVKDKVRAIHVYPNMRKSYQIISCESLAQVIGQEEYMEQKRRVEEKIKEEFNRNISIIHEEIKGKSLEKILKIKENLQNLENMQKEFSKFLPNGRYETLQDDLRTQVRNCIEDIERTINQGEKMDEEFNAKTLGESMRILEEVLKIQQICSLSQNYPNLVEKIENLKEILIENAWQANNSKDFKYFEKIMDRLETLLQKEAYTEQKSQFQQNLRSQINLISKYIQDNIISYKKTQWHLTMFKEYNYNSKHFGQQLNNDLKQLQEEYSNYINEYKNKTFVEIKISSQEDYQKLIKIQNEIKEILQIKCEKINEIFDPENLNKNFQKNCIQEVNNLDFKRTNLKNSQDLQGLKNLYELLMAFQNLDHHFENNLKIINVLRDTINDIDSIQKDFLKEFEQNLQWKDYENAYHIYEKLDQKQDKANKMAKMHLKFLNDKSDFDCRRNLNETTTIEKFQEFYTNLMRLIDANKFLGPLFEETSLIESNDDILSRTTTTIQKSFEVLKNFFKTLVNNFVQLLSNNNFVKSLALKQQILSFNCIVDKILDQQSADDILSLDSMFETHIQTQLKFFKEMDLSAINIKKAAFCIENLSKIQGGQGSESESALEIEQSIREKFYAKIQEMGSKEVNEQKQEVKMMKIAVFQVPQSMREELQGSILEVEKELKKKIEREAQIKEMLLQKEIQQKAEEKLNNELQTQIEVNQQAEEKFIILQNLLVVFEDSHAITTVFLEIVNNLKDCPQNSQSKEIMRATVQSSLNFVDAQLGSQLKQKNQNINHLPEIQGHLSFIFAVINNSCLQHIQIEKEQIQNQLLEIVELQQKWNEQMFKHLDNPQLQMDQIFEIENYQLAQQKLYMSYTIIDQIFEGQAFLIQIEQFNIILQDQVLNLKLSFDDQDDLSMKIQSLQNLKNLNNLSIGIEQFLDEKIESLEQKLVKHGQDLASQSLIDLMGPIYQKEKYEKTNKILYDLKFIYNSFGLEEIVTLIHNVEQQVIAKLNEQIQQFNEKRIQKNAALKNMKTIQECVNVMEETIDPIINSFENNIEPQVGVRFSVQFCQKCKSFKNSNQKCPKCEVEKEVQPQPQPQKEEQKTDLHNAWLQMLAKENQKK